MWLYDPLPILHAYRVMWFTFIMLAVGACTPVHIQPVATNCVPVPAYSAEWQAAFAAELDDLHSSNHYPHVEQYIVDSTRTRQALKACR